ncbi:MAG: hypothetical protein ACLQUY_14675 [Ktedonobacterales bacterium]
MTICDNTSVPAARVLLAGPDTIHLSLDLGISDELRAKLETEKTAAQEADKINAVHCPDWLGAQVLPHGARGGYGLLLETENFSVKLLGSGIPNRPGLFIELRSHFLHTHPNGPAGACEEVLAWVREHLLADRDPAYVQAWASFKAARLSRVDLHIDWQGGWTPSALDGDASSIHRFIKPARVKWQAFTDGTTFTGFVFGSGSVLARIYNKSHQATQKLDDAYFALLAERNPDTFDVEQDVWRLEFQLRREGIKGFKLFSEPDAGDDDAVINAELSAEDLEHIGTLPRFFTHQEALWQHLTQHWLRLVVPDEQANRSRWPMDPAWTLLHDHYGPLANAAPLDEPRQQIVRGARYIGKSRLLRRMLLGVVDSLEVEDASPAAASLACLHRWIETVAAREAERAQTRRARCQQKYGSVPAWVEQGMGVRLERVEQVRHRVQMLLGIFSARGVLPLHLKPAYNVADLLLQHLDDLEAEAEQKGGLSQVLDAHFARLYKVSAPPDLFACA